MISIGIAHASWQPERVASLKRLLAQLPEGVYVQSSLKSEHAWSWARRLWGWAAEQEVSVLLNDDVTLCDDFVGVVAAMIRAVPGQILSLHAQGDTAAQLARSGHNWVRAYNLTGPGYVLHRPHARSLLAYWNAAPDLQSAGTINEDNVASQWAYSVQQPMWLSLPAIVKHDASVPSTLGYDNHGMRVTSVPWDKMPAQRGEMTSWETWEPQGVVPWMENPWFPVSVMERMRRKRLFPGDRSRHTCWWCESRPPACESKTTGAVICAECLADMTAHLLKDLQKRAQ